MTRPRAEHATVLLPSGEVLAIGGVSAGAPTATAELYDPSTGTWKSIGSMSVARMLGTATLLPDGKVLVAGGIFAFQASAATNTAELYDSASGKFTATGSMGASREGATATLLPNGKVLIAGGDPFVCCSVNTAELFDPATGKFSPTGSMNSGHRGTAVLLQNGKVLMAGDTGGGGGASTTELYDPLTGTWTLTGNLNVPRNGYGVAMVVLPDGKVLMAGGAASPNARVTELYDPASGVWTLTGNMNVPRSYFGTQEQGDLTLLRDGTVLVAGGYDGVGQVASAEIYNPSAGTWSFTGSMATARYAHRTLLLDDGTALAAGGSTPAGIAASAEIFTAPDNTPPVTTASASPVPNAAGWNNTNVSVTLKATDNAGGSGVKSIAYSINGGAATTVNGASASFTVNATSTISYYATDKAGNVETAKTLVVRIDTIAPATSANTAPPPNVNGWNKADVSVTLTATDAGGSGVQSISYTVTNGSNISGSGIAGSTGSFTVSAEGVNTIGYGATDNAGNAGVTKLLTVRIDKTAPVLALPGAITANATSPAGAVVTYTMTATDNSGITPGVVCAPPSGSTFAIGTTNVSCTATDVAGNGANGGFVVSVLGPAAQAQNLIALIINGLGLDPVIANRLANTLSNAFASLLRGDPTAACNLLSVVIIDARALLGNPLTSAQAAQIIAATTQIRAAQGCR